MLNTCTFLIDDLHHLQNSVESPLNECVFACIIKDGASFEKYKIEVLYDLKLPGNAGLFGFYLDLQTNEACSAFFEWISKNEKTLLRFFFHPNYKIEGNKPLLFVNAAIKQNKDLVTGISYLNDKIIEQGYDGIRCIWLSKTIRASEQDVHLMLNADKSEPALPTVYLELLAEDHYVSKYVGVCSTDFKRDLNDLKKAEATLQLQHPKTYHLLKENFDLEQRAFTLTEEMKNVKSQLQNQKIYLKLITEQDEANKINEFYQNEYEILPLWYKKVGQIIKVCIGKRTFRSLFDNNVKKYKE